MKRWLGWATIVVAIAACGDSTGVEIDPAVAPFVGTWDAVVMTARADAPPNQEVDVLSIAAFWINIQPSGTYTATLEFPGARPEIGRLKVEDASTLTLHPEVGDPAPSTYFFATPDSLILDGATEFDFNLDGTNEPAQGHIELVRQ